jgi:hypothetical protein
VHNWQAIYCSCFVYQHPYQNQNFTEYVFGIIFHSSKSLILPESLLHLIIRKSLNIKFIHTQTIEALFGLYTLTATLEADQALAFDFAQGAK